MHKPKLIRVTTIPLSLDKLLDGQLKYMTQDFEVTAISSYDDGYLKKVAEKENILYYPVKLTRTITLQQDIKALIKLTYFFLMQRPQIVHSHTPKAGTISMLAAYLASVPIRVHTVAGLPLLETTGFKQKILIAIEKLTYRAATHIFPNSFGLKDIILNLNLTSTKKLSIFANGSSNGLNTNYFQNGKCSVNIKTLRDNLGIRLTDFVFIFVGRIVKDKGINELIEAVRQIEKEKPFINFHLLLIGSYEKDLNPLQKVNFEYINKSEKITKLDFTDDIRPYLEISDAFVFPSYREGFPNVLLQAGAMELPIIASNINGNNEIVKDQVNGILIPKKNVLILKNEMLKFIENPNLVLKLKKNARQSILNKYDQEKLWKEIKTFYLKQLEEVS